MLHVGSLVELARFILFTSVQTEVKRTGKRGWLHETSMLGPGSVNDSFCKQST